MFTLLKDEFLKDRERQRKENAFFIEHGYMTSWGENQKEENDNGLKYYSTETRWNQYTSGQIDREKAVSLAVKRMNKAIDKEIVEKLAHLDRVAAAPDVGFINVNVEWKKSRTWGNNPAVDVITDVENDVFTGYASGCGYDKESSAIATAFNSSPAILKVLYLLKEKGLAAGLSSESKTACTGHDNKNIVGYGAGYSVIPYFEGGVGSNCFWSILRKAGFKVSCHYGKREDFYKLTREEA